MKQDPYICVSPLQVWAIFDSLIFFDSLINFEAVCIHVCIYESPPPTPWHLLNENNQKIKKNQKH